ITILIAHTANVLVTRCAHVKRLSARSRPAASGITARYETAKRATWEASRGAFQSRPLYTTKRPTEAASTARKAGAGSPLPGMVSRPVFIVCPGLQATDQGLVRTSTAGEERLRGGVGRAPRRLRVPRKACSRGASARPARGVPTRRAGSE